MDIERVKKEALMDEEGMKSFGIQYTFECLYVSVKSCMKMQHLHIVNLLL